MNYSQRKHIERLLASASVPARDPDPFSLFSPRLRFGGMDVIQSPDIPRYVLPEEVCPGIPWPPGFRDEINNWSRSFLGTTNATPKGVAYVLGNRSVVMRPDDVVKISAL